MIIIIIIIIIITVELPLRQPPLSGHPLLSSQ